METRSAPRKPRGHEIWVLSTVSFARFEEFCETKLFPKKTEITDCGAKSYIFSTCERGLKKATLTKVARKQAIANLFANCYAPYFNIIYQQTGGASPSPTEISTFLLSSPAARGGYMASNALKNAMSWSFMLALLRNARV